MMVYTVTANGTLDSIWSNERFAKLRRDEFDAGTNKFISAIEMDERIPDGIRLYCVRIDKAGSNAFVVENRLLKYADVIDSPTNYFGLRSEIYVRANCKEEAIDLAHVKLSEARHA